MNEIVSHLMEVQFARGNTHLFLYTKCDSAEFFRNLGFYEIACIDNRIVFMENKRTGFENYLQKLSCSSLPCQKSSCHKGEGKSAAVIMNANPFTLGHQYLVEKAASENDILHLFIISEDSSLIPFHIRKKLVIDGTSYITNICYHDSGPYMISNATFPSYFQKDEAAIIESHALLDLEIFTRIAQSLNITKRYVGEEPVSLVTGIYNSIMQQKLPEKQIDCVVVPRKSSLGKIISASLVRKAIKENDDTLLKQMLPRTSLDYLLSEEAKTVVESIQNTEDVVHY